MRLVISLILFCLILILAVFAFTVITNPAKTYSFFSSFGNPESLEKKALVAFVPPKGVYRASFPGGKPEELKDLFQYTRQSPLPCPQYFVADKELGYFATSYETDLSAASPSSPSEHTPFIMVTPTISVVGSTNATGPGGVINYDPLSVQSLLDTKCEGIISKCKLNVSTRGPASARGGMYPGRLLEGVFTDTGNAFRMRFFLDQQNKLIFAIAVVGTAKRVYSKQASEFLNTFDIWS